MMDVRRRIGALGAGWSAAAVPLIARAADEGGRMLKPPGDSATVIMATVGALVAVMLVSALGYLYRRQRGLDWDFQRPDVGGHH